ncbi:MAG: ferritin-like domain-containing protein [Anaerolineae bacterium]
MNLKHSKLTKIVGTALVAGGLLIGALTGTAAAASSDRFGPPTDRTAAPVAGTYWGTALAPLDAAEVAALTEAINEEYAALNTYRAAIAQFGNIYPFSQIARSEQQHVDALARLFTKYGLPVPANPGLAATPAWDSVAAACQTGVEAEIADAALYDRLKPTVDNADILRVFANLQAASLNSHLPAFEACN